MNKKIAVIGSGFSALSAAAYLAKEGNEVVVYEKNKDAGGRARQLVRDGFTFDIGPTFYWMPDVFESFFNDFGKKSSDFYELIKLNPAYQVYFQDNSSIEIKDNINSIRSTFEELEPGSGKKLDKFMANAKSNYDIAIKDLVYKPGEHIFEITTPATFLKLNLFVDTIKKQVARSFKHEQLRKILEFPVLFLGAKPSNTPAFYNFMNYADFNLGTWHPKGGMYMVVEAMVELAKSLGVTFKLDCGVSKILVNDKQATTIVTTKGEESFDILLSGADYHHTETMLEPKYRQYSESFWSKKTFAPSALLFYVGFDAKLKNVAHHTLFFDSDFDKHSETIYDSKTWPGNPLFYASFPSITDDTSAPEGKEAGIFLIPIATGLEDTPNIREQYFNIIMERFELLTKQKVKDKIIFKESYCVKDFEKDYNSYQGNAYGLANTLLQTHILRPKLKSKKVKNLYFTGQLTVPGPGVPPSLISGKIVSNLIKKYHS